MHSAFVVGSLIRGGSFVRSKSAGCKLNHRKALVHAKKITTTKCTAVSPSTTNSAPVATPPSAAPASSALLAPPATWSKAGDIGAGKAKSSAAKILLLSVAAGFYLSMAGMLSVQVGLSVPAVAAAAPGLQKLLFSFIGLPIGLLFVVTVGGELFTGNTALCSAAVLQKKATFGEMMKNWIVSYFGNLIGCLAFLACMLGTGLLSTPACATGVAGIIGVAKMKTSLSFVHAFMRGILCNWLVCFAVFQQAASSDFVNKFLACALPVLSFIALGFEHSIANMFYLPLALACGAPITWSSIWMSNLIPVTLGNIVGGVALISGVYHLAYGKK
mmetsp:Transcript_1115/g.2091  ORF Transcript_1115/g.2091 Transcript_1115/m.2091 type:complete len:330 (-) Transcript_1115:1266-2255(-)